MSGGNQTVRFGALPETCDEVAEHFTFLRDQRNIVHARERELHDHAIDLFCQREGLKVGDEVILERWRIAYNKPTVERRATIRRFSCGHTGRVIFTVRVHTADGTPGQRTATCSVDGHVSGSVYHPWRKWETP